MDILKNIGFYTLEDKRAETSSYTSPLHRCELILTDRCNFKCPYCRGIIKEHRGTLTWLEAKAIVDQWCSHSLRNIRFSGGEPTIWKDLVKLVKYTKSKNVQHIALSTNGSATPELYKKLLDAGVNDFSISLDACCSATGDKMAGKQGAWERVIHNIKYLSKYTYVTVGVVLTPENIEEFNEIVKFAHNLGVADIRIISAAQWDDGNGELFKRISIDKDILDAHPILKWRINRIQNDIGVRGMKDTDNHQCPLVLDDMAILNGYHYPCIIYMREQGEPIGKFTNIEDVRKERKEWFENTNCYNNPICKKQCLDVCVEYNNRWKELQTNVR